MPRALRLVLLIAGLAAIALALYIIAADALAAARGEVVEPKFLRLLALSLLAGALLSASRYRG